MSENGRHAPGRERSGHYQTEVDGATERLVMVQVKAEWRWVYRTKNTVVIVA